MTDGEIVLLPMASYSAPYGKCEYRLLRPIIERRFHIE